MFRKKATHFFKFTQKIFHASFWHLFARSWDDNDVKTQRFSGGSIDRRHRAASVRLQTPPGDPPRPIPNTAPTHRPSPDHPAQHKNVRRSIPPPARPLRIPGAATPSPEPPAPPADITPPATRLPALIPGAAAPRPGMIRSPRSSQSGTITPDLLLSRRALPRS